MVIFTSSGTTCHLPLIPFGGFVASRLEVKAVYFALLPGLDVDQQRNLAKSVRVE
jgi:glucosamine 6-phosphate synthetase-like amidotransferase/phosphosugar isomerase protein